MILKALIILAVILVLCWLLTEAVVWTACQLIGSLKQMQKPKMPATSRLASMNKERYRHWTPSTISSNQLVDYVD